jgi:hypothetical protein
MRDDHEAQLVAKLAGPEWDALRDRAKARMEAEFGRLASDLMAGREVTPTDLEYRRVFFAGMKFLLDNPTLEKRKLDRALARANEGE